MKRIATIAITIVALSAVAARDGQAADRPTEPKPPDTDALLEQGRVVYFKRCSFCHGLLGDGNGPASDTLDPRPRDFTLGTFKFRTTQSGELPTDEDWALLLDRGAGRATTDPAATPGRAVR